MYENRDKSKRLQKKEAMLLHNKSLLSSINDMMYVKAVVNSS